MAHVSLHDSQRVLFAMVPEKGPVSLRLTSASPTLLYDALKDVRAQVDALRPNRSQHSVLLDVAPCSDPLPTAAEFNVLVKAFGMAQFTIAGVLQSPRSDVLADVSDLLVQAGSADATAGDLELFQIQVEEAILKAQEAAAWDEALAFDATFNHARHLEESAGVWEQAYAENQAFNQQQEAQHWAEALETDAAFNHARHLDESAAVWEDAIVQDQAFNHARHLEESAGVWEEAINANVAFDEHQRQVTAQREAELLRQQEALAWNQALLENAAFDEARRVAEEARRRRLEEEAILWSQALLENAAREEAAFQADWADALVYNARFDNAARLAEQTRQAVLSGGPLPSVLAEVDANHGTADITADADVLVASGSALDEEGFGGDAALVMEAPVVTGVDSKPAVAVRGTKIYDRRLRSGQREYAEGCDLVVMGCISSGAEAIADGNIHVWGAVNGRLVAGAQGDATARIICQEFNGELVCIAGAFAQFETIPDDMKKVPVMFWRDDDGIHYRRVEMNASLMA